MKHKLLITTLTTLGLSLSGASHALLIWMPDGTKAEAQVGGNKLMLQDATGNLKAARDGIYKTGKGQALKVQDGVITTQSELGEQPAATGESAGLDGQGKPVALTVRGNQGQADAVTRVYFPLGIHQHQVQTS